jgi:hypothetical protein
MVHGGCGQKPGPRNLLGDSACSLMKIEMRQ